MLNDILILDQQWLPNQSDFPPISWPLYRAWPSPIMSGFHGAFATGVACQQGTLTLPDTWFRLPLWDLLVLQLLRPDSSNLPCLYSTFHLEYPLVLSWFCFDNVHNDTLWKSMRSNGIPSKPIRVVKPCIARVNVLCKLGMDKQSGSKLNQVWNKGVTCPDSCFYR